jgi:hypothetical protein
MPYHPHTRDTRLRLDRVDNHKEGRLASERVFMRLAILMLIVFVLFGCATAEQGKRITPDDVTWIEKERTTRAEVVAKFGSPPVEFPQSSEGHLKTVQTATQIQRRTHLRKATYVYTHREPTAFPYYDSLEITQSQFWVVYDEKGVVQDYGFGGGPSVPTQVAVTGVRSAGGNVAGPGAERQQTTAASQLVGNPRQDRYEP